MNNGYPEEFIYEHFLNYWPRRTIAKQQHTVPKMKVYITLPFLGDHFSLSINARLNKSVTSCFPACRVITRFCTNRAFRHSPKDKLHMTLLSSVVYDFTCNCRSVYIGRTESTLGARIAQHIPKWLQQGGSRPRSNKDPTSAISRHIQGCGVYQDDAAEHFSVLHRGHPAPLNRILEAVEIQTREPPLCVQKDFVYELNLHWT